MRFDLTIPAPYTMRVQKEAYVELYKGAELHSIHPAAYKAVQFSPMNGGDARFANSRQRAGWRTANQVKYGITPSLDDVGERQTGRHARSGSLIFSLSLPQSSQLRLAATSIAFAAFPTCIRWRNTACCQCLNLSAKGTTANCREHQKWLLAPSNGSMQLKALDSSSLTMAARMLSFIFRRWNAPDYGG
jgi:hypothetical protein